MCCFYWQYGVGSYILGRVRELILHFGEVGGFMLHFGEGGG